MTTGTAALESELTETMFSPPNSGVNTNLASRPSVVTGFAANVPLLLLA